MEWFGTLGMEITLPAAEHVSFAKGLLILFVLQVLVLSLICTYGYRRTGNVYTGALTAASLACWIVTGEIPASMAARAIRCWPRMSCSNRGN